MADDFNPYYTWLGIPLAEQPPNHYRLLGLAPFEPDPQVIAHSADRYLGYVRTLKTGPQAAIAQKILNELTAAKRCLLETEKRAEYDARLRASLPPAPAPTPAAPAAAGAPAWLKSATPAAVPAPQPVLAPVRPISPLEAKAPVKRKAPVEPRLPVHSDAEDATYDLKSPLAKGTSFGEELSLEQLAELPPPARLRDLSRQGSRPAGPRPTKLVVGLCAVVALLSALVYFTSGHGPDETPEDQAAGTGSASSRSGIVVPKPPVIGQPPPVRSVDLLAALADSHQQLAPGWHWEGRALVNEASNEPQFQPLPGAVPEEFGLNMIVERVAGNFAADGCVAVSVPRNESSYDLLFDFDGFRTAAGRFGGANGTTAKATVSGGPLLWMGVSRPCQVRVSRDVVSLERGGMSLRSVMSGLLNTPAISPRPPHQLAIASAQAFRVSKLELCSCHEPMLASGRTGSPLRGPKSDSENLLPLIDPKKDAISGDWKFEGTSLVSSGYPLQWRAIEIPFQPVEPYKVTLKFECDPQQSPFVVLGLVRQGPRHRESFTAGVDPGGPLAGISSAMKSAAKVRVEPGSKELTLICAVKPEEVRLELNGQLVDVWSATRRVKNKSVPRSLAPHPRAIRDKTDRMFLNCRGARFTVRELTYERIKP